MVVQPWTINIIIKMFFLAFLATLGTSIRVENVYDVVIIGAGIAGIGASKKLTDFTIPHLIIQARDRIGGRILSQSFQGLQLDMGAQYIHSESSNGLSILMKEIGWKVKTVETPTQHFIYQKIGQLDNQISSKARQVHQKLMQEVIHNAFASATDLSVKKASENYFKSFLGLHNEKVKNTVKWLSEIQGNIQGADLSQLSARQVDTSDGSKDFMPQKGFQKFIYNIFQKCAPEIRLNEKVTALHYRNSIIQIETSIGKTYRAKKVISSLPLGVLKSKKVGFNPQLPEKYLKIIDKLGVGNMNKMYVSFTKRFWRHTSGWLNFVTQDTTKNKYPIAFIVPSEEKHILCFFLAGKSINEIHKLSKQQVITQLVQRMKLFFNEHQIEVENLKMTSWDTDQYTLGSYSFYKVGTTMQDIIGLRHPIDNKIWFIGEHTHPRYASMTHGAFQTGEWAAEEAIAQLGMKKKQ